MKQNYASGAHHRPRRDHKRGKPASAVCVECGKPIPEARLRALPDTETCVNCSRVEPVTEDVPGVVDHGCEEGET